METGHGKASNTTDIVQKKLVYMFLSHTSRQKANQLPALLCISTLQRDARHSNPFVRGMALRALSSLGVAELIEYSLPAVLQGFQDPAPYVRKIAAVAAAKLAQTASLTVQGI